jgi:hypothetical protein
MKTKTSMFVVVALTTLMFSLLPLVYADECVGQSCGADINLTIGNTAPTIPYVAPVSAITLNGGTTKEVTVSFNATDVNGYADLNFATAKVEMIKGAVIRTSSGCTPVANGTTTSQLDCLVTLNFYDDAGADWMINATISDATSQATNSSKVVTVNSLSYVSSNVNYFKWASATLGANDSEAGNTITLTNGGNSNYATMNIKGQKAQGVAFADLIGANKFSVDDQTGQTTGQIYMIDNTDVDVSSILGLTTHGASVTEVIYAYVDVPNGIRADSYLSSSAWAIALS